MNLSSFFSGTIKFQVVPSYSYILLSWSIKASVPLIIKYLSPAVGVSPISEETISITSSFGFIPDWNSCKVFCIFCELHMISVDYC